MSDKIMCKVEYLSEQWSWKEPVHHLLNFNDQPVYVVKGGNKLLIHSRKSAYGLEHAKPVI